MNFRPREASIMNFHLTEPSFTGWTTIISFLKKIGQIKLKTGAWEPPFLRRNLIFFNFCEKKKPLFLMRSTITMKIWNKKFI